MSQSLLLLMMPLVVMSSQFHLVISNWNSGVLTNSTPTYQTSINPLYRMDHGPGTSNISATVFQNMAALKADYMRHVPWFPYPHLAVAELFEPQRYSNGSCTTSWNFTLIDPITEALMAAVGDHPIVLGFATMPEFLWSPGVPVPADPNQQDGSYEAGTVPRDPTYKEIADYFHRLASYYTAGGFVDECGVQHVSNYHHKFSWWEVGNEIEDEHKMTPQVYASLYDAVVADLRLLLPETRFLGIADGRHNNFEYFTYHLNKSNHHPSDIPINGISYHQYCMANGPLDEVATSYFSQMDTFVEEVIKIETIKHSFEPIRGSIETFINEIGCGANRATWSQPKFYLLCSATYSYLFAKASMLQVEHFGVSQVIGFTAGSCQGCVGDEWPSTSMVNWYTGDGNARYWALKMMIEELPTGIKRAPITNVTTSSTSFATTDVLYAQAFVILSTGEQKVLIVSKTSEPVEIFVPPSAHGGLLSFVDETTGDQFGCVEVNDRTCYVRRRPLLNNDSFVLGGFGTAIVILPSQK